MDFALFDSDGDGVVTEREGVKALRACGLCLPYEELVKSLKDVSDGSTCVHCIALHIC